MTNALASKTIERLLFLGTPAISIFLLISSVTDPVNTPKMFIAGGVAVASILVAASYQRKTLWDFEKFTLAVVILFILAATNSLLNTRAPFNQKFYGTYGRNTGYLTYLFLAFMLVAALTVRSEKFFQRILYALMFTGGINLVYCAWVLAFGDFLGWNNPYGTILGLLGNPDFISAFLGMFAALLMAYFCKKDISLKLKISTVIAILISVYEIKRSHAIQGLLVTAIGAVIVIFYLIRSKTEKWLIPVLYTIFVSFLGVLSIFGTLQKGPLSFLYKRSVSFRGSYWRAGIKMGNEHPFTGVGMDSYGDWYRRDRPAVALIDTPDIKTMTNVSHNVFVDFFANGGWPLFLSYVILTVVTILAILRVTLRSKEYNWVFVGMTVVWICYQTQSIISINQMGLTVWGWVLSGALIAYSRIVSIPKDEFGSEKSRTKKMNSNRTSTISPQLVAGIGIVAGLLIAVPPLSADMKWRKALMSHSAAEADKALITSYMNPMDSYRLSEAVDTFMQSNLNDLALKYSKVAVEYNPDFFTAWLMYYYLPNATDQEKKIALANMKRLDPQNPDVLMN